MLARTRIAPTLSVIRRGVVAANAATEAEDGHGLPLLGVLVSGAGTIALGIGAANDTGWLCIAGGIAAFLGSALAVVVSHMTIDYDIYRRLGVLEGKK